MLRNKFVIVIVAVLFAAVAAYNYSFFRAKADVRSSPGPEQALRAAKGNSNASTAIPASSAYHAVWRRDPFWYPGGADKNRHDMRSVAKDNKTGIKLEGTMTKDNKGYALINGSVYGVGDRVQNATIVEISELYIIVRTNEGTRTIRIANDLIEKEK